MKRTVHWKAGATLAVVATFAGPASAATNAATAPNADGGKPVIVVLGDSLSAEYGLPRDTGWVALMRARLAAERIDYSVANASISGDTTSGGRARLPAVLARLKPAVVVVELGANDALRGVPLAATEGNLREIVAQARQARAQVLLVGMYVPSNYGPDYTQKFHGVYTGLSKEMRVPLVPFLLAGIENKPDMFQADQIHPTQAAQRQLLDNVWPALKPLLRTSSR
ncbi:GDSL-like Lipase/Acylhydrolase family protein [Burkholderia pseudomallei MSHR4377]|uniref:arylesterase n=1 Tax=Burkholderia pseudomallei TaxID=28450 RepID=UPI00050E2D39|nr:arylesterase [Burkholderia pseudomallei]AJX23604.1 GDSL-like Lipase/Acylhydrolase family protein [Burkholderia pseudomallei MSHR491]KGC67713.1 GDSL-like Lipase/Acylhydrolase family protein [Burkholderia pseudomallei]KGS25118.1 GDSL-like Lipase/Acylhydrolase family protein [Burkholderia pseudomallei MSHR7343]KGU93921.1 GDSL-like Lipase/Acylhydrolase family protein [Burkholderia pseudomallei MSHR4377]KGV09869.1 GDSL-like Lipase/Acylhydrolase family protein [Burkholderia pseudomallei TSV 43]